MPRLSGGFRGRLPQQAGPSKLSSSATSASSIPPQRLVASAMAAKSRSDIVGAQVVSETLESDGSKAVRLSLTRPRGPVREITMRFSSSEGGWKLRVPAKIVTSYRNLLRGPVIDPRTYKVVR